MPRASAGRSRRSSIEEAHAEFCDDRSLTGLVEMHLSTLTAPRAIADAKKRLRNVRIALAIGLAHGVQPTDGELRAGLLPVGSEAAKLLHALRNLDGSAFRKLEEEADADAPGNGAVLVARSTAGIEALEKWVAAACAKLDSEPRRGRRPASAQAKALRSLADIWANAEGKPRFWEERTIARPPKLKPMKSFAEDVMRPVLEAYGQGASMTGLIKVELYGSKRKGT